AVARERLQKLGLEPEAAVFVAQDFDAGRERRAASLWDGNALTRAYRDTRARLEAWLAGVDSLGLDAAARESFLLGNDAIRQLVFDPLLPAPLVDVDARRAFVDTVVRFDERGHAIWNRFLRDGIPRRTRVRARTAPDRTRPPRDASRPVPPATLETPP
ncbi:MAG: hypothetical protein EHM83_08835, partial [Burkholderiales bacterium]